MRRATSPGRCRRGAVLAGGIAGALALAMALSGDPAPARRARSDPGAVGLLRTAADAARRVPYEGRRFLTTRSGGRDATSRVAVSHTPGAGIRYRSGPSGQGYRPESAAGDTTGFTPATLALLTRNYSVVRAPDASVCGRPARVVEARRADGSPAGRFWIDRETGLMLHRELIDATGRPVVATGFTEISFTASPLEPSPLSRPLGGLSRFPGANAGSPAESTSVRDTASTWGEKLDGERLAGLRDRGWPVPDELPGRLTLYEARRESRGGALHLSYSDGLAAVSVFVQRGSLDERGMAGWQRTARRGRTVFRREALRRWAVSAGNGYVYTVVTDAPQSTATAVALSMPRGSAPPWKRVSRGARRLAAAANPFD
ncbi:MucB/RseB C-terminal domain-containing protein [Actinomadura sp. WMMA1423]|uniref:MucB/RseB C-terminal domain-containing protein n=1 Tax=Actinomadura sp. WMMA1423 TaxID=2591108 RepID=UPI001F0EA9DD|nr:MucB/RseB C-terminal domain-containing protein [Actinomadura sp. WMMA1423]